MRWLTCPFHAVEAAVPRAGRILEVGCGHGLLSLYLALCGSDRRVIGVDVDGAKVAEARAATGRLEPADSADVDFATVPPGWLPEEPADGIVIADVLYLLETDAQRRLLKACAGCLAPGGVLVVKETALQPGWKFRWNTIQETLSTRVLRITAGGGGLHFVAPATMATWLADEGLLLSGRALDRGYPWPHHLLVGRRLS